MGKYRKLIATMVGMAIVMANDDFGLGLDEKTVGATVDLALDMLFAAGTSFSVWYFRNDPLT